SETANGVAYGAPARVGVLEIGSVRLSDVPVTINRTAMTTSLLGMPFLDHFASIEVKGDRLFLGGRR
ncbi:MAG TPA: retroviral-like aspartic protease family protein, partial [Caulobacteraceae bacterium]